MTTTNASPHGLLARAAVIVTAGIFGLTYSLSAALIALDLAELQAGEGLIGANAAMHAVGVLAMAFLLPRLTAAAGLRRTVISSLLAAAVLMVGFPALPYVWLWFPLRVLLGAASESLFVLSETWLNALSSDQTRARTMGLYTAALSVGFALGPLILSWVGSNGFAPYLVGSALAVLAALLVLSPKIPAPVIDQPAHHNPLRSMRLAPLALAATTLNAAVETAGLTFLTLYAISLGWQESQATQLMSCMMFGAIVLQLPIGWLGDKMDRRRLVIILAGLAALGALAWPHALTNPWATYTLLFIWGGAFVGIYTIMLSIVGDQYRGSKLIGIYAAMGLMWGGGAFIGPLMAGVAMHYNDHGLAYFVAAACALFTLMALLIKKA
ncbi:MAG: MFS transporter [Verrucomicrobiales bacterium]|jgi:MFS family permease|nr:MFS transporter [Verrucomicrobiales bacterium]